MQDLPEVPTSKENAEKLDLPDVPSKKPVAADAIEEDAEIVSSNAPTKRRGFFSLSFSTLTKKKREKWSYPFTYTSFIIHYKFVECSYGRTVGSINVEYLIDGGWS